MSTAGAVLCLAACTVAATKPQSDLALQCELAECECQDSANPFSQAAPVVWNQNGTAGCAEGQKLVMVKDKSTTTGLTRGIVLPTYDACAHSGPRTGAGNLGRGARINDDCPF